MTSKLDLIRNIKPFLPKLHNFNDDININIEPINIGLIHDTYIVIISNQTSDSIKSQEKLILQRINHQIFNNPIDIDHNMKYIGEYLQNLDSNYIFPLLLPFNNNETLLHVSHEYYRLFTYIPHTMSFTILNDINLAYEAAKQFGLFMYNLQDFNIELLAITIPHFHDISYRYHEYLESKLQCNDNSKCEEYNIILYEDSI